MRSLTLRGIFTVRISLYLRRAQADGGYQLQLRKAELDFFYQGPGTSFLFPEYWEEYIEPIPVAERGDMIKAYYARLTGTDEKARAEAGRAWSRWEMATSR